MKIIEKLAVIVLFPGGLLAVLIQFNNIQNTLELYYLLLVSIITGSLFAYMVIKSKFLTALKVKKSEMLVAKIVVFIGLISYSTAGFSYINLLLPKKDTTEMVEIIGKKINERPSWKSKYWYIIVSTDSGTKKLKVNGYEFGKYKIGKTYPIKKTQGFFGWHVLNPKS